MSAASDLRVIRKDGKTLLELGDWKFDKSNLTLVNEEAGYEIDLAEMISGSEVLDWIFHLLHGQNDVENFLWLLEEAIVVHFNKSPQAVFCPSGKNMTVDWSLKNCQPKQA